MKWVWQVILAVFLSQGWALTNYLVAKKIIGEDTQPWILFALVCALIIQQIYVNKPKPKDRSLVEKQREIAESCLGSLFNQYETILGNPAVTNLVRVNLGLPTRAWTGFWFIKLYYTSCQSGQVYSCEEFNLRWKRGVGAIGYAWKTKDITLFDTVDERFKAPANAIPEQFQKVIGGINSVVSVPVIGKQGKVVGILNMDSTANISDTKFDDPRVIKLLQAYTDTLQPICFFDGIYQSLW